MKKGIRLNIYDPKFIRIMIYLAMVVFFPGITLAIIIAYVYGGNRMGPGRFSVLTNYISDLGSYHFTPTPYLFDSISIVTAVLLVPIMLTIHKLVLKNLEDAKPELDAARFKNLKITFSLGFIGFIVGLTGFFGIGVFSEDRSTIGNFHDLHLLVSALVWGGLAFASLFYGLSSLRMKLFIPHVLGFFMIVGPVMSVILFTIAAFVAPGLLPSRPLEWVMLVCVFWWMVPIGVILLRILKKN